MEIVYRLYYKPGKHYYSVPRNIMGVYGSEKGAKLGRKHAAVYGAKIEDYEIQKFILISEFDYELATSDFSMILVQESKNA